MLVEKNKLYGLDDITLIPCEVSNISSRSECNIQIASIEGKENDFYPLIVAPMSSVVSVENYQVFKDNKVSCIIPRSVELVTRLELCKEVFCAFGLSEIQDNFLDRDLDKESSYYVLIDIANGHMAKQLKIGKELKAKYKNLKLMGGNIANPFTVIKYDKHGFDYVRIGIGGGSRCITSTQTGIHYPMASLISECKKLKKYRKMDIKIVADGGIQSYSDVIKCLALGADYVMSGKIFAKSEVACGDVYIKKPVEYELYKGNIEIENNKIINKGILYREYYGMSTKRAQQEMGSETTKTSEGKDKKVSIDYTLSSWIDNFSHYLRSSMSYCDSRDLREFREKSKCVVISNTIGSKIISK